MRLRAVILCLLFFPAMLAARDKSPTYRIPVPPKPDFSSLAWMVGDWSGQTLQHSPPGSARLSISYGLDGRVMVFKEEISLAATKAAPASKETTLGILSRDPADGSFLFQVYSSTGFVTRYSVQVDGSEVDFNPMGGILPPRGWLSRRSFERSDTDGFTETLQLAPPRKSFFDYYSVFFTPATPPVKSETGSSAKAKDGAIKIHQEPGK